MQLAWGWLPVLPGFASLAGGYDAGRGVLSSYGDVSRNEAFGMTSQIRRSGASIAANIAECHGRENTGSFIQFLRIAQGSTKELETHLLLSQRVGLLPAG